MFYLVGEKCQRKPGSVGLTNIYFHHDVKGLPSLPTLLMSHTLGS